MSNTVHSGYINRPYQVFQAANGRAPGRVEGLVRAIIYNFSNAGKTCNMSYSAFGAKLNVAKSTIARAISDIKSSSDVEIVRRGGQASKYEYKGVLQKKITHIFTPDFLMFEKFDFPNGERLMRGIERDVYSLILTHSLDKKGTGKFEGSDQSMAAILGCSKKSVYNATYNLMKAGLVYRPKKGVNRHSDSTYVADIQLFRFLAKKNKLKRPQLWKEEVSEGEKRAQKIAKEQAKAIEDANARADRARYYSLLREKAQRRVDKYMGLACKEPRFNIVTSELARLERAFAIAELQMPDKLPALKRKEAELKIERRRILSSLGLSESHITLQYRCGLCNDSGFRENGKQCTCYDPGGGQ